MQIQIVSDLHLESKNNSIAEIIDCQCDILIIAGDLYPGYKVIEKLENIQKIHNSKPIIIFIPGNHDYWNSAKENLDLEFNENQKENIIILNNSYCFIENILFIGGTGWWDESNGKITKSHLYAIRDFQKIYDIILNDKGIKWGIECYNFFNNTLEKFYNNVENIICISHNSPDKRSPINFQGSRFNTLFRNNWIDLIEKYSPNYWIFGHTHTHHDYNINNTRLICNPMGYSHEKTNFDPNLIINV